MKRMVALVLCGLLLIPLLPLPVKALDYDPRRIGTKYTQATLPGTNDDTPWVEKIDEPLTPSVNHSTPTSAAKADVAAVEFDIWASIRLWLRLVFSPHNNTNRTEARANVAAQRHTAADIGR